MFSKNVMYRSQEVFVGDLYVMKRAGWQQENRAAARGEGHQECIVLCRLKVMDSKEL